MTNEIKLTSSAFENNQTIPKRYGCDGENINPPLFIDKIPTGTKSLTLIVDDPDAPSGDWVHWLLWNISPNTLNIGENSVPPNSIQGLNDFGNNKYDGFCSPKGTHRYFFKLYALDCVFDLNNYTNKSDLENVMVGHIIGKTSLVGRYSKQN